MKLNLIERYQKKFGIKVRLRDYQLRAANQAISQGGIIALLLAPRLGKTRIDVAITGYLRQEFGIKRWIIVCPVIAMDVWAKEIERTLALPYQLQIIDGKGTERALTLKGWVDDPNKLSILIMNFEGLWRLRKILYKMKPDKISVDESHRIKNHATRQSKILHNLGSKAQFRVLATGTFLSRPYDCFSQYKYLDPTIFGTLWKASLRSKDPTPGFLDQYVDKWGYGGHKPKTYKNLDELHEKIHSRAFYLTREQAGGFPQEQTQDFEFVLTNPALRHYKEMEEELRTMVEGNRVNAEIVLTQVLRLQQITGGFLPVKKPDEEQQENIPLGNDRIRALADLIEEYPPDYPLVIFAKYRYEISSILEQLRKLGRTSGYLVGGMKGRDQAITDFQSGKFDTMVAQTRAGGISVDLSRADTAIFYSATDHMGYEQAKARIIARTGGKVSFLRLKAKDTIDEHILESLENAVSIVTKILGKGHLQT